MFGIGLSLGERGGGGGCRCLGVRVGSRGCGGGGI